MNDRLTDERKAWLRRSLHLGVFGKGDCADILDWLSETEALRKERDEAEADSVEIRRQFGVYASVAESERQQLTSTQRERDSLAERKRELERDVTNAWLQYRDLDARLTSQLSRLRALAERMSKGLDGRGHAHPDSWNAALEYHSGGWMKGEAKTEPKEVHMPLTPCCVCGDPVCTYELDACPDRREDHRNGSELSDGRWSCSESCWEKVTEDEGKGGE